MQEGISDSHAGGIPIVVHERRSSVNFLWGFLAVVFLAAGIRGHFGAETTTGRIVGDVILGLLAAGSIAVWVYSLRHPARLEISSNAIVLAHRGGVNTQQLNRSSGDLYIRRSGGRHPQAYLRTPGDDVGLLLTTFDLDEIKQACATTGWRFSDPPR
jgi:hypothetical protein